MKIGAFDNMDRGGPDLGAQYESRLKLAEAFDRAGFYCYHVAEHHGTPLGMSPSPSVFLAAAAQRTRTLRLGALVYTLSVHHPLRLIEEICMLDHLSGGRLDLGVGRGISQHEVRYYGVAPEDAQARYQEVLDIILRGLGSPVLNHEGRFFTFRDVPLELQPVQRPHPPLWYGVGRPEGTEWLARNRVNIVCGGSGQALRTVTDRYRQHWREAGQTGPQPLLGMRLFVVVGESEREALAIARRGYAAWYASFIKLWDKHGTRPTNAHFHPDYDTMQREGQAIAGTPETVRRTLAAQAQAGGINYIVCRFAFGDLTLPESLHSLGLFTAQVMPELTALEAAA